MPMPTDEDYKRVNNNQADAIVELVDAVLCDPEEARKTEYGERVYQAALKLVEACIELDEVYDKGLDLDEYQMEVEGRRQRFVH